MSIIIRYHHNGFFSCCSVKLYTIIQYINKYSKIPDSVDSSLLFSMYKKNNECVT
jgi:hypothetical protein